jgi:uncharacterized protein YndB with AHSA1/START domain
MHSLFTDNALEIDAPAATVWDVLTQPASADRWAQAFAQLDIRSDWALGSPVLWVQPDGKAAVEGKVTACEPGKLLRFTVADTSDAKRAMMGPEDGITFMIHEVDGMTTLRVRHGDFAVLGVLGEKYHSSTQEMWAKVLPLIKEMAETA